MLYNYPEVQEIARTLAQICIDDTPIFTQVLVEAPHERFASLHLWTHDTSERSGALLKFALMDTPADAPLSLVSSTHLSYTQAELDEIAERIKDLYTKDYDHVFIHVQQLAITRDRHVLVIRTEDDFALLPFNCHERKETDQLVKLEVAEYAHEQQ